MCRKEHFAAERIKMRVPTEYGLIDELEPCLLYDRIRLKCDESISLGGSVHSSWSSHRVVWSSNSEKLEAV